MEESKKSSYVTYSEAMNIALCNAASKYKGYKVTGDETMETKWNRIISELKKNPIFEGCEFNWNTMYAKFKRLMGEILLKYGMTREGRTNFINVLYNRTIEQY